MSLIRNALLALTTNTPIYGLKLSAELYARTGRKLNSGQVYTTLERAARDKLISAVGTTKDGLSLFSITPAGAELVTAWFKTPEKDLHALILQIRLAASLPGINANLLVDRAIAQATAELTALHTDTNEAAAKQPAAQNSNAAQRLSQLGKAAQVLEISAAISWLQEVQQILASEQLAWQIDTTRPKKGRSSAHRQS